MNYTIYNIHGEEVGKQDLNPKIFEAPVKEELVHQVLVAQEANSRQVIAHTKDRSEVRGGGRKPHAQKGTGRARAGSIRSPLWKGGGVTFGPRKDRNYSKSINKKMKRKALFMCLSDRAASHDIVLLDELKIGEAKTKIFLEVIKKLFETIQGSGEESKKQMIKKTNDQIKFKTLIVSPTTDNKLILGSRNLKKMKVIRADSLNVKDILAHEKLVIPIGSLEVIEKTYL